MKREIIFRGISCEDDKWIYGYLIRHDKISGIIPIDNFSYTDDGSSLDFNYIEVIPETVGQFTGLTDKDGNKVFEGDFVKRIYRYEVKYKSGLFYLHNDNRFHLRINDFGSDFKIIGNIHESLTPNK